MSSSILFPIFRISLTVMRLLTLYNELINTYNLPQTVKIIAIMWLAG